MEVAEVGMITLAGFPFRNQLKDLPTADGQVDENRYYNCVPTSIAACVQYFDGIKVGADKLKDAVYGQGHIGGGDELKYGAYVQQHYGLKLLHWDLPSASQAIIDSIRGNLKAGQPVIVTMHSSWSKLWTGDAGDGYHVGVAYSIDESDAGNLHIMNPWGGFDHVQPVSWWRERLGNGTYPVAKLAPPAPVLPAGWTDDGTTLVGNGQPVVKGFRAHVLAALEAGKWQGGFPYGPEWGDAAGSRQLFQHALLEWTPQGGVVEGSEDDALALAAHLKEGKAA